MNVKQKRVLTILALIVSVLFLVTIISTVPFSHVVNGGGGGGLPTYYDSLPSTPTLYDIQPDPDPDVSVNLDWSTSTDVWYYNVYRRTSGIEQKIAIGRTSSSFIDSTTKENKVYYYRIEAVNNIGKVQSNEESVTINIQDPDPDVDPPDAPILNLIAGPSFTGDIYIGWSSVSDADDYGVYRSDDDNDYDFLGNVYTSSYDDFIEVDGTYYYKIKAGNEKGASDFSNVESVVVDIPGVPDVPEAYKITYEIVDSGVKIYVSWEEVVCDSYNLYREIVNDTLNTGFVLIEEDLTTTSYSTILTEDGRYTYKISAINSLGESDQSNITRVTIEDDEAIQPEDYTLLYVLLGVLGVLIVPAVILTMRKKRRK